MAYQQKPGEFALFKNDKGDNDKRPDYRGDGQDMNGNEVEVACWIKEGAKGKFMSCRMKVKEGGTKPAPQPQRRPSRDEDIPF